MEVVGVGLLGLEVYLAQSVERIGHGLDYVRRQQFLFEIQHFRGYWIEYRISEGDPPAKAQEMADLLPDAAIEKAVRDEYASFAPKAAKSLKRWDELTMPSVMKRRRFILVLG